ncbi:MAG: uracil-DNA glycosylase [Castellaniella sp.]|uniref:uracil-DNA glycosylase n=1 Tax=Castellaniella sp. TaxID=1955812 RepID=UPI002A36416C|nr:uracil-DNA glycosylase [Castellaniella sp.]MDY0308423.1 uracil-DNA glycosylase [Castellaniella sp.]
MTARVLLRPGQAAWLAEIGLDTHWLATRPDPAPASSALAPVAEPPAPGSDAVAASAGLVRVRAPAGLVAPPVPASSDPAAAVAAPADCLDLSVLDAAVAACARCGRQAQRVRAVPGTGQVVRPHYLIVGEQPGIEDDADGQPFQGDQGRLLAAMLAAARLPQGDSTYLTYVVKCRAVGGREPSPEDVAACLPWLRQQIALLQPHWILALGRVAAQAVTGANGDLDALRGGPHQYVPDQGEPIPVWVTHQPSSLLVRSAWKAEAWRDLAGLAQAARDRQGA